MRKKKAAGFTLVELIVVIAVMGILGAVGTVAYSGYVKSAQKKADMVTVGNIERAIDVGAYAYNVDVPLKLSDNSDAIQLPVGFIVLTPDEITTIQSTSAVGTSDTDCKMKNYDSNYLYFNGTKEQLESQITTCTYSYKLVTKNVRANVSIASRENIVAAPSGQYCAEHSTLDTKTCFVLKSGKSLPAANTFSQVGTWDYIWGGMNATQNVEQSCEYKTIVCLKSSEFLGEEEGHGKGKQFQKTGVRITTEAGGITGTGVLADVIREAFGNSAVRLQSKSWTTGELSSNLPSVYSAGINDFIDEVKSLQTERGITDADLTQIVSDVLTMDKHAFINNQWMKVTNKDHAFGFGSKEYVYYAMRKLYNESFASYVEQDRTYASEHDAQIHASAISGYSEGVPKAINTTVLASRNGVTRGCQACQKLYQEYLSSGACEANGNAIYAIFETINETKDDALRDGVKGAKGSIYSGENALTNYMNEVSKMYDAVNAQTGESSIVIGVYLQDDKLVYDVSPAAADPRKNP